ncbi:MAG: hypothetical protein R2991_08340 [Thermoanaerobaculia bacterium]
MREGELEMALGRPAKAQAAYLDVIEREPASSWRVRAQRLLAEAFLDAGEWQAAVESLQAAAEDASLLEGGAARREGDAAGRRLAAVDRLVLRPLAGLRPWTGGATLAGVGAAKPQGLAVSDEGFVAVADGGADAALVQQPDGSVRRLSLHGMERPVWTGDRAWVPSDGTLVTIGQAPLSPRGTADVPKVLLAATPVPFGWALATAKPDQALLAGGDLHLRGALALPDRSEPADIASDGRGRVMVLDGKSDRVLVFDATDAPARVILAGKLDKPQALAVGPLGNLYVLERGGRVTVSDRTGAVLATVGPALPGGLTLSEPRDLAVDGQGRLFISDAKLGAVVVLE